MGRRKTSQKRLKKKRPTVATCFKCLFCHHERSVECTLKWKEKIGMLKCRICGEEYQTRIHYLTEPVDVYSEWLDRTDEINATLATERAAAPARGQREDSRYDEYDDDDDDDDDDDALFGGGLHEHHSRGTLGTTSSSSSSSSSAVAEEGLFDDEADEDDEDEDEDGLI